MAKHFTMFIEAVDEGGFIFVKETQKYVGQIDIKKVVAPNSHYLERLIKETLDEQYPAKEGR